MTGVGTKKGRAKTSMNKAMDGNTWARRTARNSTPRPDAQSHFIGAIVLCCAIMLQSVTLPRYTGKRASPLKF